MENQTSGLPTCAACRQAFAWKEAYRSQDTPGSVPYNPPGHGVFRPRAFCPMCGALVAEWHIDRSQDYDEWAWYGENGALNAGKPLPPNPLLAWGKGIPVALLPTIEEHQLAVEKIKAQEGVKPQKEPESTPESIMFAQKAGQLLNQGELEKAAQVFEQAAAAGFNRRDQSFAWSAVGMYYLWKNGDAEQAFRYCRRGEQIKPGANWQGNYVLSLIYTAAGDPEKGKQELADAQRFAGTVWWDGGVDRELQMKLQTWLDRNGQDRLRAIVSTVVVADAAKVSTTPSAPPAPTPVGDTKQCPECGETIKLEAKICRFCKARFVLAESGYCSNCHGLVEAGLDGKCPACQGELLDRHIVSKLAETAAVATSPAAVKPAEAAATMAAGPSKPAKKKPAPGILSFWQFYFLPKGRIDRKTFLLEGILPLAVLFGLVILLAQPRTDYSVNFFDVPITLSGVLTVLLTWVLLMLITKRLHDLGASGWSTILWLIPLMAEPVARLLGEDTSGMGWVFLSLSGLLLLLIQLIRCIFAPGKAYFNRYGQETDFQHSDANSLSVKETLKRRRLTAGIVFAAILLPLAVFSAVGYLVDQNNFKLGLQAYEQADCTTAIGRFDKALESWRLADFGALKQRAQYTKEACLPFRSAVDQQAAGELSASLAGFAALALDDPGSILGQASQARIRALFEGSQPVELVSVATCAKLVEIKTANLIPQPESRLPELYFACGTVYQEADRGSDAVKMYQQILVDYPEHTLASKAESALSANPAACILAEELQKESTIAERGDFMPSLYFGCGQSFERNRRYSEAAEMYQAFLANYPDDSRSAAANKGLASALVKAAKASGAGEISPPQKSGNSGSEAALVVIQNDSPERLRLVFSGPEALMVELAACSSCTTWAIRPFSCPEEGPIGRYTLPAGTYEVLVESISDSGVTPFTGDWELVSSDKYYSCFYILQSIRFGLP